MPVSDSLAVNGGAIILAMMAGSAVASFIAAWSERWVRQESVLFGRSRCDRCRRILPPLDLVPVLGWYIRRGHCRYCGTAVPVFYPAIELAGAAVAVWAWLTPTAAPFWLTAAIGFTLLAVAATDIRHMLISDRCLLLLTGAALLFHSLQDTLETAVWGALAGGGLFLGIRLLYFRLRGQEGLGLGDVKLLAAGGALLGWQALPAVVATSGLLALAAVAIANWSKLAIKSEKVRISGKTKVPFGAFLSGAIWLAWLYPGLFRV